MEFNSSLESFLNQKLNEFDYYRKSVIATISSSGSLSSTINITADVAGFSSDGSITLTDIQWPIDLDNNNQDGDDMKDDKNDKKTKKKASKYSYDFNIKSIVDITLNSKSIKKELFDIVNYRTIQQLLYYLNLKEFDIISRKKLLKKDIAIDQNINDIKKFIKQIIELDIGKKMNDNAIKNKLKEWIDINCVNNNDLYDKKNVYTTDDLIKLFNSYHKIFINYIKKNVLSLVNDADVKMDDDQKSYSTYIQWDDWDINSRNKSLSVDNRAQSIYVKSLWPHAFHGPYFKSLSTEPDWKCKKCNRASASSKTFKEPVVSADGSVPITLTKEMTTETSVKSALCIIPPKSVWKQIQDIRRIHDPAYVRWMPHINIFFPFIDEKHFAKLGEYILNEIINKKKIRSFTINLDKFDTFDKVKSILNGSSGSVRGRGRGRKKKKPDMDKLETMFLNPDSTSIDRLRRFIWNNLKNKWAECAKKHGDDNVYNPHLTCGKFKLKEMKENLNKFNKSYNNKISFKCSAIYLISRKGDNPFEIKYKIPFIDEPATDIIGLNKNRRIKYYKTKRTSFTYEICSKCIETAERGDFDKNNKQIIQKKERKKEKRNKSEEDKKKERMKKERDLNQVELAPKSPISLGSDFTIYPLVVWDKYGTNCECNAIGDTITKIKSGYNTCYSTFDINLSDRYLFTWSVEVIKRCSGMYIGICSSSFHYINGDYAVTSNISDLYSFGSPGNLYCKKKGGTKYGKSYKDGDIIKMVINSVDKTIEFFVNDESQGIAFEDINIDKIYNPAISISGDSDQIKLLNFEQSYI